MRAKKHLGQHFLVDPSVAQRIADSLTITAISPPVLEIGPGKGMLTKYLIKTGCALNMIETDMDMVQILKDRFPTYREQIIHDDFLRCDLEHLLPAPFYLIGNFPYFISTQIVFKMLDNHQLIPRMVGMFQREVAERITSHHGCKSYGILSVLVQAFYTAEYLFTVKPSAFSPPPKVHSGVIRLHRKETVKFSESFEKKFRQVVKMAFNQRRKMLRNSLKSILPDDFDRSYTWLTLRPEQMSVEDFLDLTHILISLQQPKTS